jgi:hypothetical protein
VRSPQSVARSILKLKDACTIRARCFLSLRSERVVRVFNAHQAVANTGFRRTTTRCHVRRRAPYLVLFVFSRISDVCTFVRRSYQIENDERRKRALDRDFGPHKGKNRQETRSARILYRCKRVRCTISSFSERSPRNGRT